MGYYLECYSYNLEETARITLFIIDTIDKTATHLT